jgi:hypothetical protein
MAQTRKSKQTAPPRRSPAFYSARAVRIVTLHDLSGWSFSRIGEKYGISKQRAHAIYAQASK